MERRRFADFPCPVRTHLASFVLNDLEGSQLRKMTSFAGYCAPINLPKESNQLSHN
jgi:hypothetical protein